MSSVEAPCEHEMLEVEPSKGGRSGDLTTKANLGEHCIVYVSFRCSPERWVKMTAD